MRRGLPNKSDLVKDPFSLYEGVEYEEFWSGSTRQNLDEHENAIIRNLLPVSGQRIVDVGCGFGRLADCYFNRFQQAFMIDGSISLLRKAQEKTNGQAVYIASDVRQLPFRKASFDAAMFIRVFHHINDSRTCLSELHRVIANDGWFIFNYCNKQNVQKVMQWILRNRSGNPFSKEPDSVGSTFISHHPKAIDDLLIEVGFKEKKYFGLGIMDRLTYHSGRSIASTSFAVKVAPFLAWSKMASWILCQSRTRNNTSLIKYEKLIDILFCPSCEGNLIEETQGYVCQICKRFYPIDDGIIDFRLSSLQREDGNRNG